MRCRFPVRRDDRLPGSGKSWLGLTTDDRLLFPSQLDGPTENVDLRLVWNPKGIGLTLSVSGRQMAPLSNPDQPRRPDSLTVWIDTRNTQNVHRATRFCHSFCLLPVGAGDSGAEATAIQIPVPRAQADAPQVDEGGVLIRSQIAATNYQLEAWFPKEAIHGFDPTQQPLLGFFCVLNDSELGSIPLAHGPEFPYESDPSLWQTIELVDAT